VRRDIAAQSSNIRNTEGLAQATFTVALDIQSGIAALKSLVHGGTMLGSLDPTRNLAVTFEDALGRVVEFSTSMFDTWRVGLPCMSVSHSLYNGVFGHLSHKHGHEWLRSRLP
jgi:hypothetical protein